MKIDIEKNITGGGYDLYFDSRYITTRKTKQGIMDAIHIILPKYAWTKR